MSNIHMGDQRLDGGLRQQGSGNVGGNLVVNQGFRINSIMRPHARLGVFVGLAFSVAGVGALMTYSILYYLRIDEALRTGVEPTLPAATVWLPASYSLVFLGVVMLVISLCVPRERMITPMGIVR